MTLLAPATSWAQAEQRRGGGTFIFVARDLPTLTLIDRIEVEFASAKFRGLWLRAIPDDRRDRGWWGGGRARP